MDRIQFEAEVEDNGHVLRVPDEYATSLARSSKAIITVTTEDEQPSKRPERETVKFMREHPLKVPDDFKPLTREEIYDRSK